MMARGTRGSNQRPDTLMQDRTSAHSTKSSCNARPDHTSGSKASEPIAPARRSMSGAPAKADQAEWVRRALRRAPLSRRLDAERLGDGGDLGALTLDRGDELLCAAAARRLRSCIELV